MADVDNPPLPDDGTCPPSSTHIEASSSANTDAQTLQPPTSATAQSTIATPQPTQSCAVPTKPLESQPMTATSSSSSDPSVKAAASSDANAPSPYGTRSRNRTGAARPNYAEDRETEMDYDYTGPSKRQSLLSTTSIANAQSSGSDRPSGVSTRRASGANGTAAATNGTTASIAHKDYIPGLSTFSANPNISVAPQTASKKRKAPGGAPVSISNHTGSSASIGSQTTTRRASTAVNASGGSRETNMLSFEYCQGYLKNGKLKADDGTLLSVNGMCSFNQLSVKMSPLVKPRSFSNTLQTMCISYASHRANRTTWHESWSSFTPITIKTTLSTLCA